jgi:hypothetical protein
MQIPVRFESPGTERKSLCFKPLDARQNHGVLSIRCTDEMKHHKHLALWFYDLTTTAGLLFARPKAQEPAQDSSSIHEQEHQKSKNCRPALGMLDWYLLVPSSAIRSWSHKLAVSYPQAEK